MSTFFVPNSNTPNGVEEKIDHWNGIMESQFQLVHYGGFTYEATEDMPIIERKTMHNLLRIELDRKKKAQESK